MRKIIAFGIVVISIAALAVFETPLPDAVSGAMGDVPPAIGNGSASFFGDSSASIGGGYRIPFNEADFAELSAWGTYTYSKVGRAFLALQSFSAKGLSSETKISLGYTRAILTDIHTGLYGGIGVNFNSLSFEKSIEGVELGSAMGATFDIAAQAIVYKRTTFRVLAENITATNMGVDGDVELPRAVAASLGYAPYSETEMVFHINKQAGKDYSYGLGLSAKPHEVIVLRLGAATNPDRVTAGFGLRFKMVELDYAIKSHPVLPLSHTISAGFYFGR